MRTSQLLSGLFVLFAAHSVISQTTSPGSTSGPPPITSDKPASSSELPSSGGALLPADDNAAKQNGLLGSASFVASAAQAGMFEIQAGKLALSRATSKEVKEFAQRLITDHGSSNAKLATIATQNKLELPKTLDAEYSEKLSMLKTKSGAAFDQAYLSAMQNEHDQAISLFTATTTSKTVITPLRDFASITLPVIRKHHRMAMELH